MSLRKICFVAGEDAEGKVVVLYAGNDADAAREALNNAPSELVEVCAYRRPRHWKRRKGGRVDESSNDREEVSSEEVTESVNAAVDQATDAEPKPSTPARAPRGQRAARAPRKARD